MGMGARAIWTGQIKIGSATVPVKLYSAAQYKSVHFHILEAKTKTPIKQHMVNPETGEEVPSKDIRKAYEVERGTFVFLNDEELSELEPKASRDIEITHFVPAGHISHLWYERPYFLGHRQISGAWRDVPPKEPAAVERRHQVPRRVGARRRRTADRGRCARACRTHA